MPKPSKFKLVIVEVPVADLKPAAYNPRRHSPEALGRLKESIRRFGMVDPVIANSAPDRENVVIGGHMRLKAAKELDYKTVPVAFVRIADIKKEKELNVRLNANVGEWDYSLLQKMDLGMLVDIGFDGGELSEIWADALETEDDGFNVDEELKLIKKPKTKRGDMYKLGSHFLICGDSTDIADVKRLVGDVRVPMVYSDPPYNIALDYDNGIGTKGKYGGKTDDKKSDSEYREFLKRTMSNALSVAAKDAHAFYWGDQRYIGLLQSLFEELGLTNRRVCLWLKNNQNPTPQVAFNKAFEPCVYATRGKPYLNTRVRDLNEVLNKDVGTGNRLTEDVLDLFDVWLSKRVSGADYTHPTEKPPTLHEKALRRCTKPGDAVLDLFGGSGSTLVACEQLKRRAFLCEIEPIFADLIIRRYEKLTGGKAKLIKRL